MKKKIIAAMLMLVFSVSLFYGCGLLRTNTDRDLAQVVARVKTGNSADPYEDVIYKKDLIRAYQLNSSSYGGSSQAEVIEGLLDTLINNKLIIQQAVKALALANRETLETKYGDEATLINTYLNKSDSVKKSDSMLKLFNVLDGKTDQQTYELTGAYGIARGAVNKGYSEALDELEKKVKKERGEKAEEEEEDAVDERPEREPDIPVQDEPTEFEGEPETETRKEALRRFKDQILKNLDMTLDEYLEENLVSELESVLMERYVEHLYAEMTRDSLTFDIMQQRYENMLSTERQQYLLNVNAYKSALGSRTSDTFLFYHPLEGYGYVKNLLITDATFDTEIAKLKVAGLTREQYVAKRGQLLSNIKIKDLRKEKEGKTLNPPLSAINIKATDFFSSNTEHDGVMGIVGLLGGTKAAGNYTYKNNYQSTDAEFLSKVDKFIDYIFMFGTDPGMFNNDIDYLSSPKPDVSGSETYVYEFADAARSVINLGVGSYVMVGTDYGWHIILCTDTLTDKTEALDEDIYDEIVAALGSGTKFDEMELRIRKSSTYKLYSVMREEMKNIYFATVIEDMLETNEKNIIRYKDTYQNLLNA